MSHNETLADKVAANIRAEMAAQRKNAVELAAVLSIGHRAAVRRWSGQQAFSLNELSKVSRWLGVPSSTLMADRARLQAVAS